MSEIRVDYENARLNARRLNAISSSCTDIRRKINTAANEISSYWLGQAEGAFIGALSQWQNQVRAIESDLNALATSINRAAAAFEEAERRLKEAAQSQTKAGNFSVGGGGLGGGGGGSRF